MVSPIRIEWHNRPGWGEYHALRGGKPTHAGFDTYTLPKATIYGTGDNGVVIGKGYVAGGWGHYIDVRYPKSAFRAAYVQRDCHMNEASGLRKGDPVGRGTALGRVGRTGNAKTIYWIRNGVELWHVHSEVYIAVLVVFSKRTNPLPWWGVTTAGGGVTPITPDPPKPERKKKSMSTGYYTTRNGKTEFGLGGDSPGTPANWIPIASQETANEFAKAHGDFVYLAPGSFDDMRADYLAPLNVAGGVVSGGGSFTEADRARLEAVPTAVENGQAARTALGDALK